MVPIRAKTSQELTMTHREKPDHLTRSIRAELAEDNGSNSSRNDTMGDIIARRYSRRDVMRGSLAVAAISATVSPLAMIAAKTARAEGSPRFVFDEVPAGVDAKHHVAPGYDADILIRWGDPLFADAPEFDPLNQTAEAQAKQFGYNNDFLGFFPIDGSPDRGLLTVNHEYTNEELMFPKLPRQEEKGVAFAGMTPELVAVEMMAHGGTVIELVRENGKWRYLKDSPLNRRITAETEMEITGPAAGHDLMKTSADPTGTKVRGMLNNCGGGMTPWGTWVSCEENFNGYFGGEMPEDHPNFAAFKRYGVPSNSYAWAKFHDRFDVAKEPNEANRFGWAVEIDPTDPNSVPKKRTALGRFKHENAQMVVNKDGRVVTYMGDDERFDYVYRFITNGTYNSNDRAANMNLLDEGILSVARFNDDGTVNWLPLVHGEGALTAENGFNSQAEVLINARMAADAVGATKMDRPEDVESNAATGKVYVMLTNNTRRKPDQIDTANPRAENAFGHIIELTAPEMDHGVETFKWEILVKCGDPSVAGVGATFSSATTKDGWFGMPDQCAIDAEGRLWIGTDGNSGEETGRTDGLWALETEGQARGTSKLFFRCPAGAELCGPLFTPNLETAFVAVQHPGDDGETWPEFGRVSTFDDPSTRWPDFQDSMPPRPSVVAITKSGGGKIGV
jgi:secreted PhoX family phosphatase